jgi:4-diphosphocytidyl-2C-methyl-D-erythritol kinase
VNNIAQAPLSFISGRVSVETTTAGLTSTSSWCVQSMEFKISNNLEIKLQKNIPVGAGLGGGSSNARCFIDAINIIFNLKLSAVTSYKLLISIPLACNFANKS